MPQNIGTMPPNISRLRDAFHGSTILKFCSQARFRRLTRLFVNGYKQNTELSTAMPTRRHSKWSRNDRRGTSALQQGSDAGKGNDP
jgi:hypothetical protein